MNELLKVEMNENKEPVISGRMLHEFLGVKSKYQDWFPRMLAYGFVENTDYILVSQKKETNNPKNPTVEFVDHILKLPMAKEIAMIQRNDKGKQARQYFISVEEKYNSPEITIARALLLSDSKIKSLEGKIAEDEPYTNFGKAISQPDNCLLIAEYQKILANDDIIIGTNHLFKWLRDNGYLSKSKSTWNEPKDCYLKQGLFKVKTSKIETSSGTIQKCTPLITGKGQKYFYEKLRNKSA